MFDPTAVGRADRPLLFYRLKNNDEFMYLFVVYFHYYSSSAAKIPQFSSLSG